MMSSLQDQALLLLLLPREQRGARGVLEDLAHALVGLGRALEVLDGADLLAHVFGLVIEVVSASCGWEGNLIGLRTCSGVTGFCDVLCSSSIVF